MRRESPPSFSLGLVDRRLQRRGAGGQGHIGQGLGECRPVGLVHLAGGELIEGFARELAEAFGVEILECHADDTAGGDEARRAQMEKTGQKLAPRKVAGRAHEDEHLRILRTHPGRILDHVPVPPLSPTP